MSMRAREPFDLYLDNRSKATFSLPKQTSDKHTNRNRARLNTPPHGRRC
jgi:hypothetical protein